jgi:hypothetical protein
MNHSRGNGSQIKPPALPEVHDSQFQISSVRWRNGNRELKTRDYFVNPNSFRAFSKKL